MRNTAGDSLPRHTTTARKSLSGNHDVGTRTEERPLGQSGRVSRREARRQTWGRARTASGGSDPVNACPPATKAAREQAHRSPIRLGWSGVVPGARACQRAAGNTPTQPPNPPCSPAGRGRTAAPPQRPRAGRILLWQPPPARRTVPATASRRRAAAAARGGRILWNFPARILWNFPARGLWNFPARILWNSSTRGR